MNKKNKLFSILLTLLLISFEVISCNTGTNMPNKERKYSNEYLEVIIKEKNERNAFYKASEIKSYNLTIKFDDPDVENLSVNFGVDETYSFNIFKDCSVELEVSGYNNSNKKIAYGSKKVNFTTGNDIFVLVLVNMLEESTTVTVDIDVNGNIKNKFLEFYDSGKFYDYWFSDLGLTSLRDYLEKGRDLAYFETNSGIKIMIDRPYGNDTVVSLDSNGNFWLFDTKNEDCQLRIRVNNEDKTITQGLYSYNTVYIYDSNGWAHNTWSVEELNNSHTEEYEPSEIFNTSELDKTESICNSFLNSYTSGSFYDYWFSDLQLTSLRDYLEKGRDLVYFKTTSGVKLMIDRPYGNETIVVLDSNGNFWLFNTKNGECQLKIQVNNEDKTITQGRYSYNTVYIYDSNGWAHNTWSVDELR